MNDSKEKIIFSLLEIGMADSKIQLLSNLFSTQKKSSELTSDEFNISKLSKPGKYENKMQIIAYLGCLKFY